MKKMRNTVAIGAMLVVALGVGYAATVRGNHNENMDAQDGAEPAFGPVDTVEAAKEKVDGFFRARRDARAFERTVDEADMIVVGEVLRQHPNRMELVYYSERPDGSTIKTIHPADLLFVHVTEVLKGEKRIVNEANEHNPLPYMLIGVQRDTEGDYSWAWEGPSARVGDKGIIILKREVFTGHHFLASYVLPSTERDRIQTILKEKK